MASDLLRRWALRNLFPYRLSFVLVLLVGLGSAQGQFETRTSFATSSSGSSIAVGDFNVDGKLDVAVAAVDLQVFLGNGDGTFGLPTNYLAGSGAIFVTSADLNNNGKLDLVVADLNGLYVLMGNGDGTFQTPLLYTTACIPIFAATGDFNNDKKLDLLVTYSSGDCPYVSIFLANGDGTFQQTPINTTPLYSPSATGIADFNRDGKLDLAVAEQFGTISQVEILLGDGNGSFSAGKTYPVNPSPKSIAVADFLGDGKQGFAVASLSGGTDEYLGNGNGTFKLAGNSPTSGAQWITAADLNGDGKPDLAVAQLGNPGIAVILNNGNGTFQPPAYYPAGKNDPVVAAGDFNHDHKTDLIVADYSSADAFVLLNTGVTRFAPTSPINFPFQLVGATSPPQTVTLTNTGTSAVQISSLKASSPFHENNNCGKSVAAGAMCNIEIAFKPQNTNSVTGTITISDSASSKPQVIDITGTGTVVKMAPARLTFGDQKVGTESSPQAVTVWNQGSTPLDITQIYVLGNYKDFPETNNCPASLNADASCVIRVTFGPTQTGARSATLYVSDNGGGSPQTVPLSGTGD
jgi:hypothetical protein